MSQTPAGWYADPSAPPGVQPGVRWWDGARWTEHVQVPAAYAPIGGGKATTTPDGQPLADWGRRLGAFVVDWLITTVLATLIGFPFVSRIVHVYADFVHASIRATDDGTTPPDGFAIYAHIWGPFIGLTLVTVGVSFVYHVTFLRWRGATPAKLLLGMQVRLRERPGQLPWKSALLRWLTQFGPNFFSGLYGLLDGLWPLWDDQRQAIHDKAARTNVVLTR